MKYVVLVSHGMFAEGLKNALTMLAGEKEEVLALGLHDGQSADEFYQDFSQLIQGINDNDEVILLGDLIGGSPLTTAMSVINETKNVSCKVIGGMNLPLALTTILMKDALDNDVLIETVLSEAQGALKEFVLEVEEDEEI